ncbi:peptide deformylase [Frankia sp. AgKG'84/4]
MAVLPIRTVGDPVLRTPTAVVTQFDAALARLVADMIDTMYAAPGVGLAAPQIGVGLRVFVFDVDYDPQDRAVPRVPLAVVNPTLTIIEDGEVQHGGEGCLSVPGLHYPTSRAMRAVVRGVDAAGEPVEYAGEGLRARCFQHEVDHLDGMLFLQRLTGEARVAAVRALREQPPLPGTRLTGTDRPGAVVDPLRALRRTGG